jgi:cytochrome c oxidase subunit III
MPGTPILDDIELIIEDVHGTGRGKPPSRDGDDGGDGEGGSGGERTPDPRRPAARKYSTALALAMLSIVMLFMALAAALLFLRRDHLHTWAGIRMPRILWANTAVLLSSSAALELARRRLARDDPRGFRRLWTLTTLLGVAFILGQIEAWRRLAAEGVYAASVIAGSFFYLFTALHAAHLLGGICALLYVGARKFDSARLTRPAAAEIASYYWHFMDGLWLFLFALLFFAQ